jgi:hypothetical protein
VVAMAIEQPVGRPWYYMATFGFVRSPSTCLARPAPRRGCSAWLLDTFSGA